MSESDKIPQDPTFIAAEEYKNLLKDVEGKAAERPSPAGPTENPLARFNLNQNGQNPDWQPTTESGLPKAEELIASPEMLAALKETHIISDPDTGQRFSALFLNWPSEPTTDQDRSPKIFDQDRKAIVALPQFNITTEHAPLNYLVERIALETGEPMLVMNNPSTGESTDLTKEQVRQLKDAADFSSITKPMLRAIAAQGIGRIDLFGYSMGARLAASMAAEARALGIEVENLVLMDSPGVQDLKTSQLMNKFLHEGKDLKLYQTHPQDPRQIEASGADQGAIKQNWRMAKGFVKALGRRGMYTAYPEAMTKPTMAVDALKALNDQPDMTVTLINGGASKVSPTPANSAVEQFLNQRHPKRTRHIIFSGESHPFGEGAKRIGHLVKTVLQRP